MAKEFSKQMYAASGGGIFLPDEFIQCPNLSPAERILLAVIYGFRNSAYGCFATNDYLEIKCNLTTNSVRTILSNLIKRGFLIREMYNSSRKLTVCMSKIKELIQEKHTFESVDKSLELADMNEDYSILTPSEELEYSITKNRRKKRVVESEEIVAPVKPPTKQTPQQKAIKRTANQNELLKKLIDYTKISNDDEIISHIKSIFKDKTTANISIENWKLQFETLLTYIEKFGIEEARKVVKGHAMAGHRGIIYENELSRRAFVVKKNVPEAAANIKANAGSKPFVEIPKEEFIDHYSNLFDVDVDEKAPTDDEIKEVLNRYFPREADTLIYNWYGYWQ